MLFTLNNIIFTTMIKSYKYKLNPNESQKTFFEKSFGCIRFVYNWALSKRIEAYQKNKERLSCVDLCKMLTSLKKEDDKTWLSEVSSECLQQSIRNMDSAFTRFFREKKGFPKFKSKKDNKKSYKAINSVSIDFDSNRIKLPKIGWVKFFKNRTFEGKIGTVTVSKTSTNKYYVSILVDDDKELPQKPKIEYDTTVGIDVGIKDFAVLSNGQIFENPKYLEKAEQRLKVLQKRFSKKKKGSKRREKARIKLSKAYEKVINCRTNFIHQVTSKIVRENQTIIIEDLNIEGMMKNRHLAKHISSASWNEFFRQLQYKCEWYGKNLLKIGRFEPSSKMCTCGYINNSLKLSDRKWVCPNCKQLNDRDLLVAINIKRFGLQNQNLLEIKSSLVEGVGDVEWSTLVGTVKRQYVSV